MEKFIAKYWGRALASRYLYAWVPYLRYVGLNGSLVRGDASSNSDIDLMVVAEPGHIFTVRFLMVGIIALIGIKRSSRRVAGRLCVNYFLTSDNLDIKPHNQRVAEAYRFLVPLVNQNISNLKSQISKLNLKSQNYHSEILQQNKWMRKHRVSISEGQKQLNALVKPVGEPWQTARLVLEMILFPVADIIEKVLKKVQIVKIMRHTPTGINDSQIVVSDKELRFHPSKTPKSHE